MAAFRLQLVFRIKVSIKSGINRKVGIMFDLIRKIDRVTHCGSLYVALEEMRSFDPSLQTNRKIIFTHNVKFCVKLPFRSNNLFFQLMPKHIVKFTVFYVYFGFVGVGA